MYVSHDHSRKRGGAHGHAKSIVFASKYTTKPVNRNIKMLKDVGMTVPKLEKQSAVS